MSHQEETTRTWATGPARAAPMPMQTADAQNTKPVEWIRDRPNSPRAKIAIPIVTGIRTPTRSIRRPLKGVLKAPM
ncbi:hypothetical protein SGRIM119S_01820 [Streptomyces griseorubiginosus]